MDAQEADDRLSVVDVALEADHGLQPLSGEAFSQEGEEVHYRRPAGELLVGRGQEPLDGLHAVDVGEVLLQAGGGRGEGELLVQGDPGWVWLVMA